MKGKKGGTLRRGWTIGGIVQSGGIYKIDIINNTEYASYVEYGHRQKKKGGYGWVAGHLMMTISAQELETITPKVLEAKIKRFLKGHMK